MAKSEFAADVTWERVLSIWWAFVWRSLVYALPALVLAVVVGVALRLSGQPDIPESVYELVGSLVIVAASVMAMRVALKKRYGGFAIRLVPRSTDAAILTAPAQRPTGAGQSEFGGELTWGRVLSIWWAYLWRASVYPWLLGVAVAVVVVVAAGRIGELVLLLGVALLVVGLAAIPASVLAMGIALRKRYGSFAIRLLLVSTGAAIQATAAVQPVSQSAAGFSLRLSTGKTVSLGDGVKLRTSDIPGLQAAASGGSVAEVVRNPNDPNILGLKNLSQITWPAMLPNGGRTQVDPNRSVRLQPGAKISFGSIEGEIQKYEK